LLHTIVFHIYTILIQDINDFIEQHNVTIYRTL